MIPEDLLIDRGASVAKLNKGEMLFSEGDPAVCYYQVKSGKVKMNNYNKEGREFIQRIFGPGESFGEPPLFGDWDYPANAIAITETSVWRLERTQFIAMLLENPPIHLEFTKAVCERLYYKAKMAAEMSTNPPEHRVMTILSYFKDSVYKVPENERMELPFTRQQLADLLGLRVETTIKTIKRLEEDGHLEIRNRKVYV